MKITQKRTCNRCFVFDATGQSGCCELGYCFVIETKGTIYNGKPMSFCIATGIPQEPCPKPKTGKEYIQCLKYYKKSMIDNNI